MDEITIGNSTVLDAFVDFNLRFSNPGELHVVLDEAVERSTAFPIPADETGFEMIAENDAGVFFGWQDGPAHPPAATSPRTRTVPVTHESLGEIERVPMYDHEVKKRQNEREPESVMGVRYEDGYLTLHTTRVELAKSIIDTYVNGPLGTDTVSYWAHRGSAGWADRNDAHDYVDAEVVLVADSIYTWTVEATFDVGPDERVYDPR